MSEDPTAVNPYVSPETRRLQDESDTGFSWRVVAFAVLAVWGTCATCAGMVELLAGVGAAGTAGGVFPWEDFPRLWLILSGASAVVGGLFWIAAAGASFDRQWPPAILTSLLGLPLHAAFLYLNLIHL